MAPKATQIDISENRLRNRGQVLDILLSVHGTKQNIIWATDSYQNLGRDFASKKQIKRWQVTGSNGKLIQPRAAKSKEEQKYCTKDKAEVFTPLKIVKEMNIAIDWSSKNFPTNDRNWVDYITEKRLEITCGEGPFIAGRYNPTANTGAIIEPYNRVGFLDRKLQEIHKRVDSKADWLKYAELALKSSYGYEWQGDNLLIARENILMTMNDFYEYFCSDKLKLKTKQSLTDEQLEHFAQIISWNIWQMDGLKYVQPMSCRQTLERPTDVLKNQLSFLPLEKPKKVMVECEGCRLNDPCKHTGVYARIKDWTTGKTILFVDLLEK